jgi:hypothetical protein
MNRARCRPHRQNLWRLSVLARALTVLYDGHATGRCARAPPDRCKTPVGASGDLVGRTTRDTADWKAAN